MRRDCQVRLASKYKILHGKIARLPAFTCLFTIGRQESTLGKFAGEQGSKISQKLTKSANKIGHLISHFHW